MLRAWPGLVCRSARHLARGFRPYVWACDFALINNGLSERDQALAWLK